LTLDIDNRMKPISIWGYIALGYNLFYFTTVSTVHQVHGEAAVISTIDLTLSQINEFNLRVTNSATGELKQFVEKIRKTPQDYNLSREEVIELKDIIKNLHPVLMAEANVTNAFILSDKRIDLAKLMDNVPALFAKNSFDKMPDIAKFDFKEAGKCIALERPTAAAFHLLRGTESVLRYYYECTVKRNRIKNLNWGLITDSLRNQKKPPAATLLNNLDNIRSNFRNPTQHPEKTYTLDDAQDLFGLCEDVVNRMVSLISVPTKTDSPSSINGRKKGSSP